MDYYITFPCFRKLHTLLNTLYTVIAIVVILICPYYLFLYRHINPLPVKHDHSHFSSVLLSDYSLLFETKCVFKHQNVRKCKYE